MFNRLRNFLNRKRGTIYAHCHGEADRKEIIEFVKKLMAGKIKTRPLSEYLEKDKTKNKVS